MRRRARSPLLLVLVLCLLLASPVLQAGATVDRAPATPTPAAPVLPPTQPATGPGGAEVTYDGLLAQHFGPQPDAGGSPTGYWLFEPTRPRSNATAGPLPLVLFLHGYDVPTPEWYHAWIDHLARRGAIIIYPDFQAPNLPFDPAHVAATDHAAPALIAQAVHAALTELAHGGHARPDLTRLVVVGHSLGAFLAPDYAATAAAQGLPVPRALLLGMPGCAPGCSPPAVSEIPPTTRVLVLVGNQDTFVGEGTATQFWAQLGQIPPAQKDYIRLIGDAHGTPALLADHAVPLTTAVQFFTFALGALNAFDWYGTWKWLDALMSCSFAQRDCAYALGNTPQQRFMGRWSDGVPVTQAQVAENPSTPTP